MRKGYIEFRYSEINKLHELVRLQEDGTCYVIAFFIETRDGYVMKTIGDRFFQNHDAWIVGKYAIGFLNACFEEGETGCKC